MPVVSVIIPMYKVEKYLRRCLDSVKNQTFTEWQAICVDDGSPDKSGEIAEEYAKFDKRFIVLHKKNGGLSDARNYGMKYATGDFIMFLDSDDFIHPQMMDIAYSLALRNSSDIVSFSYDRVYRPRLMLRHFLHLDTDNVVPWGIHKKYNIDKIKTLTTDDVFKYATERAHNAFNKNRKWLIKHCQVWKNMYRKSLISDIPFIKGILFEDFPWWSSVMLRKPRVTIAPLPMYYYIPNFGGIVLSAKQLRIIQSLCAGMKSAYILYHDQANDYQMKKWSQNFRWYFIDRVFHKIKYLYSSDDINIVKQEFSDLYCVGALDKPYDKFSRKLRKKIMAFIDKKSKKQCQNKNLL